ncbi:MAG: nucleotidyltransferase domain-containing protein [Candidatus Jordarchaeales archaeon]
MWYLRSCEGLFVAMKPVEFAKRIYEKRRSVFERWEEYVEKVKERGTRLLPETKVYVFGSVVREDYHPMLSDIDVAVVSPGVPEGAAERVRVKLKLTEGFDESSLEIHLLTPKEWETYRRFIDVYREI